MNDLVKELGFENVSITEAPHFYWNGRTVTDDETAQPQSVGMIKLEDDETVLDFIKRNEGRKIVIKVPLFDNAGMDLNGKYIRGRVF